MKNLCYIILYYIILHKYINYREKRKIFASFYHERAANSKVRFDDLQIYVRKHVFAM